MYCFIAVSNFGDEPKGKTGYCMPVEADLALHAIRKDKRWKVIHVKSF